jgi:hypothetical protein
MDRILFVADRSMNDQYAQMSFILVYSHNPGVFGVPDNSRLPTKLIVRANIRVNHRSFMNIKSIAGLISESSPI